MILVANYSREIKYLIVSFNGYILADKTACQGAGDS